MHTIAALERDRTTIEQHTDLQDNMPELTKLSVGAQQDAAEGRAHNDKMRAQGAAGADRRRRSSPYRATSDWIRFLYSTPT